MPDRGADWWRGAVVYQIYPRSFADGNGDGVGDLAGLIARLGHIADLVADAVWLSPVFPSPGRDFGYDVADYCDIDPLFGTLADMDRLIAEAHRRGLRVLLDWVPNHTSDAHPWFVAAASSRDDPHRDFYVWRDPGDGPDGRPNNWLAAFPPSSPAWTFHQPTQQYYLHNFLASQPDLNWENPEVRRRMLDTLRFWLDRGVDGFRMDVIHLLGKEEGLGDDPPDWVAAGLPHVPLHDRPSTHRYLRAIRALLDRRPEPAVSIGEVALMDPAATVTYQADNAELHLTFNFAPLYAPWGADAFRAQVDMVEANWTEAWPTWVLSNHDQPRHRTRFGSAAAARAATVLLCGLRGTVFLYAGEELGLPDAVIPADRVVDPGGRDGCRAPIPWTEQAPHGWGADPWLPWVEGAGVLSAEAQSGDPTSMRALYRRMLGLRRARPELRRGAFAWVRHDEAVLCWCRYVADADDGLVVAVNFTDRPQALAEVQGRVLLTSVVGSEVGEFGGELAPDEAIVVEPRGRRRRG